MRRQDDRISDRAPAARSAGAALRPRTAQDQRPAGGLIPAWVDGALTPIDKLETHRRGLRHKAISVFAMAGDRMLLQRRALEKYHTPGLWANTCCTHPHWGESAEDCARRRLIEELGVSGLDLRWRAQIEYRADVGAGLIEHELVEVFTAEVAGCLKIMADPSEVCETRWVSLPALEAEIAAAPERFTPWLKIYLAQHRAAIFGEPARA